MQVPSEVAIKQWAADCPGPEDEHFRGMSILCCEPERCGIFVMHFVNIPVQRTVVQRLVRFNSGYIRREYNLLRKGVWLRTEVVKCVFKDEEQRYLTEHGF